jgi:hypothetical protein
MAIAILPQLLLVLCVSKPFGGDDAGENEPPPSASGCVRVFFKKGGDACHVIAKPLVPESNQRNAVHPETKTFLNFALGRPARHL